MLRLACILGVERGIKIAAPIHDALLVEAPAHEIESAVATMTDIMRTASRVVLNGFELRTEAKIIQFPDRYADPRGTVMWERTMGLIGRSNAKAYA